MADFTSGCKKFEPWIEKSEAKKSVGMVKPKDLQEALDQLADAKVVNYFVKASSGLNYILLELTLEY